RTPAALVGWVVCVMMSTPARPVIASEIVYPNHAPRRPAAAVRKIDRACAYQGTTFTLQEARSMKQPHVEIIPLRPAVRSDAPVTLDVLVRVTPPPPDHPV